MQMFRFVAAAPDPPDDDDDDTRLGVRAIVVPQTRPPRRMPSRRQTRGAQEHQVCRVDVVAVAWTR